ncbi:MAG: autotransporter-associated beta strand repeat-containing protein [Acidobacteriota bacterium]|nr:autotransporter-associated beta strand repeat-containing protein [Acidobacteriota bacterium]
MSNLPTPPQQRPGLFSPNTAAAGSQTIFGEIATAGNGYFSIDGGDSSGANAAALIDFQEFSTAGNSELVATSGNAVGGQILFSDDSAGGTARLNIIGQVYGGDGTVLTDQRAARLDISPHNAPGVSVGSIEGNGLVFLGAAKLTVGSNRLSTLFSGLIQDGGVNGGTGGSLAKTGGAKLTLTGANTYSGGTIITKGTLLVKNTTGSATDSGAVQLNAGKLGGTGIIAGAVTVGTGSSSGATLLLGNSATGPANLTINSALTFRALSTYKCVLNMRRMIAGRVTALGVTINSNATFRFAQAGTGTLSAGSVFTIINNTSASPIGGTFGNLPDGSTFTVNGNTFKADYQGGDGNDLTLTVVP